MKNLNLYTHYKSGNVNIILYEKMRYKIVNIRESFIYIIVFL